ncbi:hypothetical protein AJ88_01615 [Mesorhizobium amorphae CCBAU 01583]|nr:hypothetical protein AJ88_01615 [Mesorhizobium amorphae CCBAU 01583]
MASRQLLRCEAEGAFYPAPAFGDIELQHAWQHCDEGVVRKIVAKKAAENLRPLPVPSINDFCKPAFRSRLDQLLGTDGRQV